MQAIHARCLDCCAGSADELRKCVSLTLSLLVSQATATKRSRARLFLGWRTGRDAASVAALRESGAVIVGKVVTTEFTATEPRGTRNPWDRKRTPGGSSSGSAANRPDT